MSSRGSTADFASAYTTPGSLLAVSLWNMPSAQGKASVIDSYIRVEMHVGRMMGHFPRGWIPELHINRMGMIPKGHTVFTDISHPEGESVNNGISQGLCSLRHSSVQRVAATALQLGRGTRLAKLDIKSTYRLVPVLIHTTITFSEGVERGLYVNGMLPFSLCSGPKVFTAVAVTL